MTARLPSLALMLVLALLLAGCSRDSSNPAPPRVTAPADIPVGDSAIAVPISARIADLEQLVNAEVPQTLVTINETKPACVKLPVIGNVSCRLQGEVTRGRIRITGKGDRLKLSMPVDAIISAKDIGKVIKSETATAAAVVVADVRLTSIGDWQPSAKVAIDYRWTRKPGIDFLGKRITFAGRADPELQKLLKRLEASVPNHRDKLANAWSKGFTSIKLNDHNPPVWLRLTPEQLRFRRYHIEKGVITLELGATARTETFVGERPADPPATPLPPHAPYQIAPDTGFRFHIPVIADYAELEPVLEKALKKLEKKPISLPNFGDVRAEFTKVTLYPTTGSRLAIGLGLKVKTPRGWLDPRGTVWVTGQPFNEPGSQRVKVRDLRIAGSPDSASFGVLLAVAQSVGVRAAVTNALSEDFSRDYNHILAKAGDAIAQKRLGDFVLTATIADVKNGVIYPAGQGLYMPVDATGTAALRFDPRTR
jgi:Domain of unknown function (DUF4403)